MIEKTIGIYLKNRSILPAWLATGNGKPSTEKGKQELRICKRNRTQECVGDTIAGYGTICKLDSSVKVEVRNCDCPRK